jgi:CheY-like chemotaxis protein
MPRRCASPVMQGAFGGLRGGMGCGQVPARRLVATSSEQRRDNDGVLGGPRGDRNHSEQQQAEQRGGRETGWSWAFPFDLLGPVPNRTKDSLARSLCQHVSACARFVTICNGALVRHCLCPFRLYSAGMSGNSILLVEDDRDICTLLADFLVREAFAVEVAQDGAAVDRAFARAKPDLVILDLMLPGEDGLSICRRLRARSAVPIICSRPRAKTSTASSGSSSAPTIISASRSIRASCSHGFAPSCGGPNDPDLRPQRAGRGRLRASSSISMRAAPLPRRARACRSRPLNSISWRASWSTRAGS